MGCHTRKMQLLWTKCVGERDVHFNTIVRDLFPDCLTKFDSNLITVEWPIVSSCAVFGLNFCCCLANDVIDIEKKSMQKPQAIKKFSLDVLAFLLSLKKSILQFCRLTKWKHSSAKEEEEKASRSQTL